MSKIATLAQSLQEQSKKQEQEIERLLKSVSSNHISSITNVLQQNQTSLEEDLEAKRVLMLNNLELMNENIEKANLALVNNLKKSVKSNKTEINEISEEITQSLKPIRWLILKSWLVLLLVLLVMIGGMGGVIYWQGQKIQENIATLDHQEEKLEFQASQGAKMKLQKCDGRICVQIDETAQEYDSYRVIKGY